MKGATTVAENKRIDSTDKRALLARLRELHMTEPGDDEAAEALACSLSEALKNEAEPESADVLLDELRELYIEQPENAGISVQLAHGLFYAFNNRIESEKAGCVSFTESSLIIQ